MYKTVAVNDAGLRIGEDHPQARYTNHEIDLVKRLSRRDLERLIALAQSV
ncbi:MULTISPECIES: hypothetical protein [Haematospirillum]|nr:MULTISPECIES: hypothetical protein [Haematospirillum]NKD56065.1 hypothetical protein [Haematospirillum sp. H4890]NKD76099.1 hypothetical protein [Haematospirillum sp. H4485]NKD86643.1 hypothetical protein [Haematospirillum jordaniae]